MSPFCPILALLPSVLIASRVAEATTYYVDFQGGADDSAGTAPESPWRHCPGDPAATGRAASAHPAAGDTVRFKGGVVYRGSITIEWSGREGQPLVFDGNSDGAWGAGRATVDGSEPLTGWRACSSPEICGGNTNWRRIHVTDAPAGIQPGTANLCEGERLLHLAQDPKQPDPFFMDKVAHFHAIPNTSVTTTSLVDPERLNQSDERYWDGAWVMIWATPNACYKRKIARFMPAENKILFDSIGEPYRDRDERYAVYNSPHLIEGPGEYAIAPGPDGRTLVYLWPLDERSLGDGGITRSARSIGFNVAGGSSHVTIQGFRVQGFSGSGVAEGIGIKALDWQRDTRGLTIRDNRIARLRHLERGYGGIYVYKGIDCLIEGNEIFECPLSMGVLCGLCTRTTVRKNVVRRAGCQSIWFMGCRDSQIVGNEVHESQGTHANGISVYEKSDNVLVLGNRVFDSNIPFTFERSQNLTIACNVFHGGGQNGACISWGDVNHVKVLNNICIEAGSNVGLAIHNPSGNDIVVKNNILAGFTARPDWDVSHNLYTGKIWNQGDLRKGELLEPDLKRIFVDPGNRDYRLKPSSPAIDAGVPCGLADDICGTSVPQGKAVDIGAFESGDLRE